MDYRKDLLLASAARLYSMGVDLEAARAKLKELVERGVPYDSDQMKQAYQNFKELEQQWKALERQHLELRDEIVKDGQD
jgi:cbb3-type cytochrome oxidase cytochrome c subunit